MSKHRTGYQNHAVIYKGERLTYPVIAKRLGVSVDAVKVRANRGWTAEEICETPKQQVPARIAAERNKEVVVDVKAVIHALSSRWVPTPGPRVWEQWRLNNNGACIV